MDKKENKNNGLVFGVIFGFFTIAVLLIFGQSSEESIANYLIFYPMLAILTIAGISNFSFWMATGLSIRSVRSMKLTMKEASDRDIFGKNKKWIIIHKKLQFPLMFGAGYISLCPVIGLFLIK